MYTVPHPGSFRLIMCSPRETDTSTAARSTEKSGINTFEKHIKRFDFSSTEHVSNNKYMLVHHWFISGSKNGLRNDKQCE